MPLIHSIINSLISATIKAKSVRNYTLTDSSIDNKCIDIPIIASNPFWVLKLDDLISNGTLDLYPFYQNASDLKKCCDYIILYHKKDIVIFFLCEMKSNSPSGHEPQLDAAYNFTRLLTNTAKRILRQDDKVKYKGILFSNRITKYSSSIASQKTTFLGLNYFERECGQEFNLDFHSFV